MSSAERGYIVQCCPALKLGEHKVFLGSIVAQAFPAVPKGERMSEGYKRVQPAVTTYEQFRAAINWNGIASYTIKEVPVDGGSYEVYRYQ